ncbi:hypothetical protein LEM8419_02846 [Neolewinella maritima]|uniref:TolC family protein n=1 Tax=Neolewinella maritima TaxID=1383882 RepID=A0ABM9B430_9BACT|nr:TolC family protein [Neolewinella maritima]CAH1001932.1 hypothetical protein LEM8419_02846 [Neolewinella maritima]
MRPLLYLLLLLLPILGSAQDLPLVLTETEYLELVATHHPLAVRAALQRDRAAAVLRQARGGFDPKVYGDLDQKYFKGTKYYSHVEGGVKIPIWFGVELNAAYERNDGTFLNPEFRVPEDGLYAAGLTLSLGQGLFFDERRAELQRARIYQQATVAERQVLLNELLYEAGGAYWEWAGAQAAVSVYEEAVQLARVRYEAVVAGARLGDRPAIDTLEARIQVQSRQLSLESAQLELANTIARLNAFLWLDGVIPVELEAYTRPAPPETVVVALLPPGPVDFTNPELVRTQLKVDQLEVDQRLQRELLKPRLDVKYNALLSGGTDAPLEDYSSNNYKWGIKFSQPLLLRKERGKLQLTRIKLSETQLELSDKAALLRAKVAQAENEANVTVSQFALAGNNVTDYAQLLAGEQELFRSGESSLFLVNSREVKYIDARVKQIELLVKHRKARLARAYATGEMARALVPGAALPTD